MEIILALADMERGRRLSRGLGAAGVFVREQCATSAELCARQEREPAQGLVVAESLPDGEAEMALRRLAALAGVRAPAVVLIYQADRAESVRERVRLVYGLAAEVVVAGARPDAEVAQEAARVLQVLQHVLSAQEREAHGRLSQPVPSAPVPVARGGGLLVFAGVTGGVGTSTLVANLAAVAAVSGYRALVVDAQFGTGGSALHHLGAGEMDTHETPDLGGLLHAFQLQRGKAAVAEVRGEVARAVVQVQLHRTRHADLGVVQVSADPGMRARLSAELVLWAAEGLLAGGDWDVALVDAGSHLGDPRTQALLQAARRGLLVTATHMTGVTALLRVHTAAAGLALPDGMEPSVILRQWPESRYRAADVARHLRSLGPGRLDPSIYAVLPNSAELAARDGRPVAEAPLAVTHPQAGYSTEIWNLALKLGLASAATHVSEKPRRRWGLGWLAGRGG